MDLKEKTWTIAMALVAKGDIEFDLSDCRAGIERIEAAQEKIREAYKERGSEQLDARLKDIGRLKL